MPASLLDHPVIGRRYFFPRRCTLAAPFMVDVGDATLACSFQAGRPGAPTIVHFHGNGEIVADYLDGFAGWLAGLGCSVLLAEYRGYGMSTGEPRLGRMLDDVAAVMAATGAPPRRTIVFGRSVGSIFALEAVARFPEAAGLVLESGVADPLERILMRVEPREVGASPEAFAAAFAERLDHRRKIGGYRGPVLVLHTLFDELVDVTNAERLAEWAGGPITLELFDRGGHNDILRENETAYLSALAAFVAAITGPSR
jgi:pimeloyl-ACP methyl ester carboxylesterase